MKSAGGVERWLNSRYAGHNLSTPLILETKFEHHLPTCILKGVSRLTRIAAMLALVLYGLASMHRILEGVPGFDFLKTCCFVDSAPAAPR